MKKVSHKAPKVKAVLSVEPLFITMTRVGGRVVGGKEGQIFW